LDNIIHTVRVLSGEESTMINGEETTIHSRHGRATGNELAATYIQDVLRSYGYTPYEVTFSNESAAGPIDDIVANLAGAVDLPILILGAHYDSMPDNSVAPGADDNASGVAAVLETARILAAYEVKYPVRFMLFDEQETGELGSGSYASTMSETPDSLLGMINVDMIGYDGNGDNVLLVNTRSDPPSEWLSNIATGVNTDFEVGLAVQIFILGYGTDNLPFWHFGFPAIGVEEHYRDDWNPWHHTTGERIFNFNLEYFEKAVKLIAGITARAAEVKAKK